MAYLNADNYRLWVGDGATPEVFHEVAGQRGMSYTMSRSKIDQSTKADEYAVSRPGIGEMSLSLDILVTLPDANGYSALELALYSKTVKDIQIRKDGSSGDGTTDVVFTAAVYVTSIAQDFQAKSDVGVKIEFMLAATPGVNLLAA
ncbi:Phage tail tube protein [Sphingomonas sp. YR710]|uniref:phage tail tube protein n=1 Tax=Sphingomonas sp. YR710 TaxID=1882773 RepID=UPI00088B9C8D|nr:phage tail tube protein [Sphingomonas sp. YR710]SDC30959.1 Phage tail tube protein [Sphingomonas sp. YR710]